MMSYDLILFVRFVVYFSVLWSFIYSSWLFVHRTYSLSYLTCSTIAPRHACVRCLCMVTLAVVGFVRASILTILVFYYPLCIVRLIWAYMMAEWATVIGRFTPIFSQALLIDSFDCVQSLDVTLSHCVDHLY